MTAPAPAERQSDVSGRRLATDEIHLWHSDLAMEGHRLAQLASYLDQDERARAARFHFERDRRRFKAGRGVLRQILASYLDVAPIVMPLPLVGACAGIGGVTLFAAWRLRVT